uniref:Uncharacterized protein n=1 Tax=Cacopsylla melanoneura TaxID=428564 RepID=A0A8D8X2Q8_9HEMI
MVFSFDFFLKVAQTRSNGLTSNILVCVNILTGYVVVVAAGIRSSYFYVGGFLLPKGQFQVSGHILWSLPQISDCQGCRVTEEEVANIMWSPVVIFTFVLTYSWFGYTVVPRGRRFSATMEL